MLGGEVAVAVEGLAVGERQLAVLDGQPQAEPGLCGFATLIAPVIGVVAAGTLAGDNLLLFMVPGVVGAVLVTLFAWLVREKDSRGLTVEPLTARSLASKYVVNPRKYPDFSWNWLGRFAFYFGLTLNTTFTAFFFASRLGATVEEVAGTLATVSGIGVLATAGGALGGGFLSDRLRSRRVFVLSSGCIYGVGTVVMATSSSVPLLFTGSLICSAGLGMFSAVDQALALDVLPERETSAGRFMGIFGFATSVPQALAPLVAPLFLAVGAGATGEKNYTLLYLVAAAFTVAGGVIVLRVKSVR
ncbi:MFS transporter [Nonomuraea angiospora]|uniref:MFS transporter n=1 Tax=Nonomuraea angiospora TaxID=46172 RepID=UPI0029A09D3A|nr:MFS transporter [Nonomuraea angiospora]MDX3102122.1 MFS transporter [Nonomuraea angiospora]